MTERLAELEHVDAPRHDRPARVASTEPLSFPAARGDLHRLVHGPAPQALLLRLQQGAGNRAVGAVLQRCACGCGGSATCHEDEAREERAIARAVLQLRSRLNATSIQRDEADEPSGPVALDDAPAAAPAAAAPTFKHSGSTVTIDADSAIDFSNKITAQIGTPHTEIELEPDVQWEVVGGVKKITSVGLTVTTKIVKVRFGMGRPNDKHKKAIGEMVTAIKAHEAQHRAIIVAEATAALAKAQKLVGTSKTKEAFKIIDTDLGCAANKKHEALDAKEGLLTASEDANGNVTISKSASGAKYPCGAAAKSP